MAAVIDGGPMIWSAVRDEEGHRTYKVSHLVKALVSDGPATIMQTPGLPAIGSTWIFSGTLNDVDIWAFCYPTMRVSHHQGKKGEPHKWWEVTQTFSTKPLNRCQDTTIEDPLLEPDRLSGSFIKYTTEALLDGTGSPILNSSHEVMRGPQVEIDANRPTVRIEQNRILLQLGVVTPMIDTTNDATLWGLSARKIKLSNFSWERLLYGVCNFYYIRIFDFDINFNTFDRVIADEGTMVLNGHHDTDEGTGTGTAVGGFTGWQLDDIGGTAPDATNPQHFIKYQDINGNPARILLDGAGLPLDDFATPVTQTVVMYPTSNFLTLGIPTVIG